MSARREFLSLMAVLGLALSIVPAAGVAYCNTGTLDASPREVVGALIVGSGVSLSAHLYVSPADIDRTLEVVRAVAGTLGTRQP